MKKQILSWFLIFSFIVPIGVLLYLSISTQWFYPKLVTHPVTFQYWIEFLSGESGLFVSAILSVSISLMVSSLATISGFIISRGISYHTASRWWLVSAYFPYVIAPVVLAVMLNYYFLQFGLSGSVPGVMIAQLFITVPYAVILFHGYWNQNVRNLEHMVETLGGGFLEKVRHAILPSARGLLAICFFQCFLISWFEYGLTQYIGIGKVETLTIMVYQFVTEANPYLAALAGMILVAPPVMLLFINRRFIFNKGWGSVA